MGKQVQVLTFEPAVKVAEASALERKQRTDGHEFARIKLGLRVLGHVLHPVINRAKELCNNVFRLHESLLENGFGSHTFPVRRS